MKTQITTILCVLMICVLPASADFADFGAQLDPGSRDAPIMMADFSGGTILANFNSSYAEPNDEDMPRWQTANLNFANPKFQDLFGTSGAVIQVLARENPSEATNINFVTNQPFPGNARLIVMDMDGINERVTVVSNGMTMTPPQQMETATAESTTGIDTFPSAFPVWDAALSQLKSTGLGNGHNNKEAAIFDISGKTQVSVTISSGEPASSWIGIATAVPEPGSLGMIFLAACFVCRSRRQEF